MAALRRLAGFSLVFCFVRGLTGSSLQGAVIELYQAIRKFEQRRDHATERDFEHTTI
jgi:hypothetical protein